jgi:putative membrane protein
MLPFPSLPWFELARFRRSRLTRAALVAVAVVPLFYGVLYVWANWDPVGNLDRVPAAVVNQDQPTEVAGRDGKKQPVAVGRLLAGKLISNPSPSNFDWNLTDAADARAGLESGKYLAVVTIPKSFSAAATSVSKPDGEDAVQARIDVRTNDAQNYLSGTIAQQVGAAATGALNAQVSGNYLDNLYVGFSTLHDQIGTAAAGAGKLSSGAGHLADGVKQAGQGANQLTVGLRQLSAGTAQLPSQARQLDSGAQQLAGGARQLSTGLTQLDGGLQRLALGTQDLPTQTTRLDAGAGQVAAGATQLASGAGQLSNGAGNVASGAQFVADGLTNVRTQARGLAAGCAASGGSAAYCAQVSALAAGVEPLATGATGVAQGATFVRGGASQLSTGATQLSTGAGQLRAGTQQLAAAAPALSSGLRSAAAGGQQLDTGALQLAGGSSQLAAGTAQLAGAAPALANGISQAAGGSAQLSTGTTRLADGADQLDDGANQLANGLRSGAEQIPSYTAKERANLRTVAATPVVADTSRIHAVQTFGAGVAPYFMALALWVGAMSTFMLLRALSPRTLASTASSWRVALAGYLPGAVLVTVQAVLLVGVLHLAVGLEPAHLPATLLFAVLIALTYAAMNQAFIALFGGAGRFLALIFISLQLTTAGGTYPIDTAPAFFSFLHTYLPMTYAVEGLRACIAGGGTGLAQAVFVLLVWAIGAALLTVLAAGRQRTWSLARLHTTAIV